jgi:dipeptidase E
VRLVLYSDQQIVSNPEMDARLLELVGRGRPRIAYIPSAAHPERLYYNLKRDYYERLGADLAVYIEPDRELSSGDERALMACDAVHLSGGNTFLFLEWLRRRGVLSVLRAYALEGGLLVGDSAGAILMTPDVRSATLAGDVPPSSSIDLSALALVDFHFWPHCTGHSAHGSEAELLAELPCVYACADGAGVIVDAERIEQFGSVTTLRRGHSET